MRAAIAALCEPFANFSSVSMSAWAVGQLQMPHVRIHSSEATPWMTAMVKGLGCRLASQSHPCRNPRSAHAALWGFRIWPGQVPVANCRIWRGELARWMSSAQHLRLSDDGVDEIGVHDDGRWSAWHEPSCRPATWRDRLIERIMPGHEGSPGLVVSRSAARGAGTTQQRSR